jgi:hypothetical protein
MLVKETLEVKASLLKNLETTCVLRDIEAAGTLFYIKSSRTRVETASAFCRLISVVWSAPPWSIEKTKASQYKVRVCSGCLLDGTGRCSQTNKTPSSLGCTM